MNQNLTEIFCVMDRSGSMSAMLEDAIGGFNTFLKTHQETAVDECRLSLVLFDHEYDVIHWGAPVRAVGPLTTDTYKPRGTTALLDAVGRTVDDAGKRFEAMDEKDRPGAVIFFITTDGLENASKDYDRAKVRAMIERQQNTYNWQFIFMGANHDAFAEARKMGIDTRGTMQATKDTYTKGYVGISGQSAHFRSHKTGRLTVDDNAGESA